MNSIDIIILAGGLGKRLQGVVTHVPKPLAPINGNPFLDIILGRVEKIPGASSIVLAVSHKADLIIEHYRNRLGAVPIVFSIEEEPLGTGGAIKKALSITGADHILCLNGDSYIEVDFKDLLQRHIQSDASLTVVVKKFDNTDRYGSVTLDAGGHITAFLEKRAGAGRGLINAGVYLFKRQLFDIVSEGQVLSFEKELLPQFISQPAFGYVTDGRFIDIGTPESYQAAHSFFSEETS